MKSLKSTKKAGSCQQELHYNSAHVKKDISFNLSTAIQYFSELEAKCDETIQKQDDLIREVTLRCRDARQASSINPGYAPLVAATFDQDDPDVSASCKSNVSTSLAPMASQAFILEATVDEAEDIEQLELEIIQFRQRLRAVEDEIVNHSPLTPTDLAKKMKFLAGLVADGGEVDMDAFARLVEEGSDMLLSALGEVGFF